ncbi:Nuclear receptor 2C2-associated protein [Sparganum proliferum]
MDANERDQWIAKWESGYFDVKFTTLIRKWSADRSRSVYMASTRLSEYIEKVAVSSVLNRDTKQYGKNNLFDQNPETCWNSDAGSTQWISVKFKKPLQLETVRIQFQGGFAAEQVILKLWNEESSKISTAFYPPLDFFGRIVVYSLDFTYALSE